MNLFKRYAELEGILNWSYSDTSCLYYIPNDDGTTWIATLKYFQERECWQAGTMNLTTKNFDTRIEAEMYVAMDLMRNQT